MLAALAARGVVLAAVLAPARVGAVDLLDEAPPAAKVRDAEHAPGGLIGVPLRLGLFGGWHATAGDLDVLGERRVGNEPEPGAAFGLRAGWRVARGWGLELLAGAVPAGSEWLVPVVADVRWRPLEGGVTPTIGLGAGIYAGLGKGGDVDLLLAGAIGVEVPLGRTLALRVELGLWGSDAVSGTLALTPVATVGIDLLAWREPRGHDGPAAIGPRPRPVPKGCPRGAAPERCGDLDQDAVIDAFDHCPVDAGAFDGCPDADNDKVPSPRDACPARAGRAVDWGCPRQ
ncbi:MAG: hypothetical protein IT385_19350 [Deltaproteobacteria bacterium]|nr:hypothetical protein [Deltaproteobacteria bacterium]